MKMETRLKQLDQLHSFVEGVDKDLTLILQNLQWDRKNLLSRLPMVTCRYNNNHKLPLEKAESHKTNCFMKLQGYSEDDELLPEPLDIYANTLVKLSTQQIITILNDASRCDPMFKRGNNWESRCSEPWSLARLQATYTGDERRAIHNAVVQAVPSCHDLADLALPGSSNDEGASKVKSRVEILAELRDMRRRRTKYRQAAKTRNYSDVLRDVIKTQMESYSGMSQLTEQSEENNSTRSENMCIQNDYPNNSSSRDRETYISNKDVRGERPSKYYKSHTRETNRYNSSSNTNYNSKRIQNSRNYNSERYNLYSHEKFIDRDKISTKEKAYEYDYRETRDKNTSSSYRRYEDKDRSERNVKETQIRNSYKRKKNRDSYTSDEFKDSRTTDRESKDRRKSRRDERSSNYNNTYRSRVCIKKERSESPERTRPGKTQTPPAQRNNRHSELYTNIKQERIDSPDNDEKRDYGNTSRPINDTNSGTCALIKVEKIETPDFRHNHSRSECGSPHYTEDREHNITIKRENDRNTDKRTGNKQEKNRSDSTSRDKQLESSSRRIVYFEKSLGRQHRERKPNDVPIKYTGETETKSRNTDQEKTISHRHGHHKRRSSSTSSSDTTEYGHDIRTHDKYNSREHSFSYTRDYRRKCDSTRYKKSNSFQDKDNMR